MRLSKRIFATSMVILCVLIDTAVIPFEVANPVYYPKFTLLTIITIALLMGRTQGILYGLVGGVCMDISLLIPVGLTSVLYTLTGFLSGYIGRKMRVRILSSIVAPIVSMMVYEIAMTAYYMSVGGAFDLTMLLNGFIRSVIGCALIQLMYIGFKAVLKPKYSRYEKRR
ncbi:MAG: rod shape-determining protein MreD [Clostridia bacterium]|nr:rod shape-determining protein MreD [Clostridia bacterium]